MIQRRTSASLCAGAILLLGACSSPSPTSSGGAVTTAPAPATTAPAPAASAAAPSPSSAVAAPSASVSPSAVASAGPAAVAPVIPSTPTKITIGYSEIYEGNIPLFVAKEKGFLLKNGLDADLQYAASANAIAALLSGQIQISNGGGSEALSADSNGADLVMVGTTVPVQPYVFETTADIKSVSDLKGQKVGVSSPGSSSDIATRIGLQKVGLDPDKDVNIVAVGSEQNRNAALLSGSIQGGLSQPPGSIELEAQGLHPLFSLAELKLPTLNNTVVVPRGFVNSQRDVVQRYIDAIVESIAYSKKNKAEVLPVIQQYLKVDDQETLSKTYDYAFGELFAPLPYPRVDQFSDSIDTLAPKNPKIRDVDVSKIIDDSFVKSAADRNLDKS